MRDAARRGAESDILRKLLTDENSYARLDEDGSLTVDATIELTEFYSRYAKYVLGERTAPYIGGCGDPDCVCPCCPTGRENDVS